MTILFLEDAGADFEFVLHELRQAGLEADLRRVETRDEYLAALKDGPPDLILSDYGLPSFSGREALSLAREICPRVLFIFVSGTIGEEAAVEALRAGATDYVLKDKLAKLPPAVDRALEELETLRQRDQADAERKAAEVGLREREVNRTGFSGDSVV
jgi:CheY-like chemotaxis protein